jgi:putative transposase
MSEKSRIERKIQEIMPSAEEVEKELGKAKSMDDFFVKEGIFARLFANTIETMLESELSEELGYEPYEAKGKNSGNSRNGHYPKKVRTSAGETTIQVPRNRNGEYEPQVVKKHVAKTNELEDKIIGMCAKGMSVRDIRDTLKELYGVEVSPATLSAITDKVWELVEAWQNGPLASIYPIIYLDAIHLKLRGEGKIENTAVYTILVSIWKATETFWDIRSGKVAKAPIFC